MRSRTVSLTVWNKFSFSNLSFSLDKREFFIFFFLGNSKRHKQIILESARQPNYSFYPSGPSPFMNIWQDPAIHQ